MATILTGGYTMRKHKKLYQALMELQIALYQGLKIEVR